MIKLYYIIKILMSNEKLCLTFEEGTSKNVTLSISNVFSSAIIIWGRTCQINSISQKWHCNQLCLHCIWNQDRSHLHERLIIRVKKEEMIPYNSPYRSVILQCSDDMLCDRSGLLRFLQNFQCRWIPTFVCT